MLKTNFILNSFSVIEIFYIDWSYDMHYRLIQKTKELSKWDLMIISKNASWKWQKKKTFLKRKFIVKTYLINCLLNDIAVIVSLNKMICERYPFLNIYIYIYTKVFKRINQTFLCRYNYFGAKYILYLFQSIFII